MPITDLLEEKRDALLRIAGQHGARDVRLFGSYAKGTAGESGDIDILVTLDSFPHTVLASGTDPNTDKRIRTTDTGRGKPPVNKAFHPIPDHAVFLASPLKGFPP